MTKTGLVSSPKTQLVRYDATWSYLVSHNPQTDRFSAPYPELVVNGSSPFHQSKPKILPNLRSTSELHFPHNKPSQNAHDARGNSLNSRDLSGVPREGRHRRLKFGDKTLVDNGALTLGDVNAFFDRHSNEDPDECFLPGGGIRPDGGIGDGNKFKRVEHELDPKLSGESQVFGAEEIPARNKKVSYANYDLTSPTNSKENISSRSSGNFLRLRVLQNADEGASLRMSRGSATMCNKGPSGSTVWSGASPTPPRPSQRQSAGNTHAWSRQDRASSILRRGSKNSTNKKHAPQHIVFEPTESESGERLISRKSEQSPTEGDLQHSPHFRQHRHSGRGNSSTPELEEVLIDRHEGHTREFENLRVQRIKVDEKEEGSIFRLSFDPSPDYNGLGDGNGESSSSGVKDHVKFLEKVFLLRSDSFERLRHEKIIPGEKEEGTAHARTWRIYHDRESVYGLTTLFPEKDNTGDLRKFQMSRKENPDDQIILLTHDNGKVFGFHKTEDAPKRTCLRNNEEMSEVQPFQLIYTASNSVVGFKINNPKDDHSAYFERLRQEMIIKGEKEEGDAFKILCRMVHHGYDLEEHFPLEYFEEHDLKFDTKGTAAMKINHD